jgi:hypothetical protein
MNSLLLDRSLTGADIDFLNQTEIDFDIRSDLLGPNDSGWCDATTGCRIPVPSDRVVFYPANEEEEIFLKLKYLTELTEATCV